MRGARNPGGEIQDLTGLPSGDGSFDETRPVDESWRRERDSNPRYTFWAYTRFPVVLLQPLGHLSAKV
jgi:hypothetical protein